MRIDVIHANAPASGKLDEARASSIRAAGAPGTEIAIRLPHHAPTSITSQYDDARAAPSVLEQVLAAAREGADALVINCTADTAVEAAREAVAIPVVGVSEAALHLAAQLADTFSVLTFGRSHRGASLFCHGAPGWECSPASWCRCQLRSKCRSRRLLTGAAWPPI